MGVDQHHSTKSPPADFPTNRTPSTPSAGRNGYDQPHNTKSSPTDFSTSRTPSTPSTGRNGFGGTSFGPKAWWRDVRWKGGSTRPPPSPQPPPNSQPRRPETPTENTECHTASMAGGEAAVRVRLEKRLQELLRLPVDERRRASKELLVQWHPDKNLGRGEEATRVFQWLQNRRKELLGV